MHGALGFNSSPTLPFISSYRAGQKRDVGGSGQCGRTHACIRRVTRSFSRQAGRANGGGDQADHADAAHEGLTRSCSILVRAVCIVDMHGRHAGTWAQRRCVNRLGRTAAESRRPPAGRMYAVGSAPAVGVGAASGCWGVPLQGAERFE